MKDFVDRISSQGKENRRRIIYEDGTMEYVKIELADEPIKDGTPINRDTFMELQGFIGMTTEKVDGGILQTNSAKHTVFTKKDTNGNIIQTFTGTDGKLITKTIRKENGKIIEEVNK